MYIFTNKIHLFALFLQISQTNIYSIKFIITLGNINHLKILDHNKEKVSIPTEEAMKMTIYVQKQK